MKDEELEKLAELIAGKITPPHPKNCLLFDDETAAELRGLAKLLKQGKKAATVTAVTVIVTAIFGLLAAGFLAKVKSYLGL